MDRGERRHRTETVRARRIDRYKQIDCWRWFKSDERHANYIRNRGWRWMNPRTEEEVEKELAEDKADDALRCAKMRNEYIVGYRDNDWVNGGRERKMKIADYDYWSWLMEVGIKDNPRIRTKARQYN